jgi:hypothetical protein
MEDRIPTEQVEVVADTENQNVAKEPDPSSKSDGRKRGLIDSIIQTMADTVASLVSPNQQGKTRELVRNVLTTVYAMCAEDEYAIGIVVDGELYRYSDYCSTSGLKELLIAKRVVVTDVPSARDFLVRDKYRASGKVLTPATFAQAVKQIQKGLRSTGNIDVLSRPDLALLSEAAKSAVNGGKVAERTQHAVYFLSLVCDDEARVDVKEWARTKALTLFD